MTISRQWLDETIYEDSDIYFKAILCAIDNAKTSIEIETYIFERGVLAERLVKALIEARARGVWVRVLGDGFGAPDLRYIYATPLEEAGIEVKLYKDAPWAWRRYYGESRWWIKRFYQRLLTMNRRNHRKCFIIDGDLAFVGSQNISDNHLKEAKGENHWLDVGVAIRGPEIQVLQSAFYKAYSGRSWLSLPRSNLVVLNHSFQSRLRANAFMIRSFRQAKEKIWIQVPYFVPIRQVMRELIKAARRGVDVRVIVPRKNDVNLVKWISLVLLRQLIQKGIKVFEFQPKFTHQKVLQIDDQAYIGSTNLNHRSFIHDLEVQVRVTHKENLKRLEESFRGALMDSIEVDDSYFVKKGVIAKLTSRLLFALRYWC